MDLLKRTACLTGLSVVAVGFSQAQLADKKALTLQIGKQVAAAAGCGWYGVGKGAVKTRTHLPVV
jgi:hypothetical protein